MQTIDLNGRPRSRNQRAGWYAAALDEQASSGLSMAAYAEERGVPVATLYQWKRRLSAEEEDRAEFETTRSMGLVELSLEDPQHSGGKEEQFVIRLGNDRCVEIPRHFDSAELIRLLEILEAC